MGAEITVFIGQDGAAANLGTPGTLQLYQKATGSWHVVSEASFALPSGRPIGEIRKGMEQVLTFMGTCKIFVAGAIHGLPYYQLEKAGCSVWEYEGQPLAFLDELLEQEEAAAVQQAAENPAIVIPVPEDTGNGHYRISIKEIQEQEGGITSKQVLQPFLRRGAFYELEVVCNHIPPWLEAEVLSGSLRCQKEVLGKGNIRLLLQRPVCSA